MAVSERDPPETQDEQSERMRLFAEAAFETLLVNDGRYILDINAAGEDLSGYGREELIGRCMFDLVHPEDRQTVRDYILSRRQDAYELRIVRRDGTIAWLEARARPARYRGRPARVAVLRDVTERRRAEMEARKRALHLEVLHRATQGASEAADTTDALRRIVHDFCETLGWSVGHAWLRDRGGPHALVSTEVWWVDRRDRRAPFVEASECLEVEPGQGLVGASFSESRARWIRDLPESPVFLRRAAAEAAGLRTGLAVPVPDGTRPLAVLEFYREAAEEPDSETMQLVESLARQVGQVLERRSHVEALGRSNEQLQRFASMVAHDLRSPLRAVVGWATLLGRTAEQLPPESAEHLHRIVESATRMDRLVQDVLEYARAVRSTEDGAEATDAEAVIEEVVGNLRGPIEAAEAVVRWERLPTVRVGRVPLLQLLQNLVSNALQYRGPRPPRIEIHAERQRDMWRFEIRDNGRGIRPELQRRVFEPFQRGDTAETRGSGLGLALCREIVEGHGGWIDVWSSPGVGTTFAFTLPTADP